MVNTGTHLPAKRIVPLLILLMCIVYSPLVVPHVFAEAITTGMKSDHKNASEAAEDTKKDSVIDLQYLLARDEQLARKNVDLQYLLDKIVKPDDLSETLQSIKVQIDDLEQQVDTVTADLSVTNEVLASYEARLNKLSVRLEKRSAIFQEDLASLLQQHMEWSKTVKSLDEEISGLEGSETYKLLESDLLAMKELSQQAVLLIADYIQPLHKANTFADELRVKLYALKSELRDKITENQKEYLQQTSPPFYTKQFYTDLNLNLVQETGKKAIAAANNQISLVKTNYIHAIILLCIIALSWNLIRQSRKHIPASYRWYTINTYPICSAVFLCTIGYITAVNFVYDTSADLGIFTLFLLLSTLFFIRTTLTIQKWVKKFFSRTLIFLTATILIDTISGPSVLFRLYLAGAALYGIYFSSRMVRFLKNNNSGFISKILFQVSALFSLLVLVATVTGYDQFSRYIFIAFIESLAAGLICWILYCYTTGFFEFVLKVSPVTFLNRHCDTVTRQLTPLFWVCYALTFLLALRQIWLLDPDSSNVLKKLLSIGITLFSWKITLGFALTIAAVLYGTLLISKWLQTILLQDVMPRYNLERGVQISISRIVHYVIFLIGFIALLKLLGLELTQLAILGGALGVGIGFGLQAIVNNFVSGLILLFERPVKVGDVIQIGQEWGEIKSLGLRATVVQTFDNAEIVIPNGDLITNQVTNWTLGERRVRLKISIGVAYGTEIDEVLTILKKCADEHPQVLSTPQPTALFLAFGPSSLDFELRVWIPNIDDKLLILSELNQEIDNEFKEAGIVIPFPQTDVHLHTTQPLPGAAS